VKAYVGVTDDRWFRFLSANPMIREVNFWRPGGSTDFKALQRGEPFLFKTHWPDNRLVGGGFFEGFVRMKITEAWDFFGIGNGVTSLDDLRIHIASYRKELVNLDYDPVIGCILLNEVVFVYDDSAMIGPNDFNKNVVQGKTYSVNSADSNSVVDMFVQSLAISADRADAQAEARSVSGPVFGEPRLVRPRLGQGGFKAIVRDAYSRRCAVTGHKIVPTLQAAHIVPVSQNGENRLDNGVLLRSDVHTMFDRGYLGISPNFQLHVSPRLRTEFGNGDEFYAKAGQAISLPTAKSDRPNPEFLSWHMDTVFKTN
jgi:putative restriction endonuclease